MELCQKVFGKTAISQNFVSPSGEEYSYLLWTNSNGLTSIIFPLTNKMEIVALKQYRHGANRVIWEVPGGCSKKGSGAQNTASRELLEETGFKAARIKLLCTKPLWFEPANLIGQYYLYLATGCKKICEPKLDKTEYIEVVLVPWEKWLKMTKDGTVLDSKTIVATHMAEDYVKNLSYLERFLF